MALSTAARHLRKVDTFRVVQRPMIAKRMLFQLCFPAEPSQYQTDSEWIIDEAHQMRHQPSNTGAKGALPQVQFRTKGFFTWNIPIRGWETVTTNIDAATSDPALRFREQNMDLTHFRVIIDKEIRASQAVRDPTVVTQGVNLLPGARFDDLTSIGSNPIAVFQQGALRIQRRSGLQCNFIGLTPEHMRKLRNHQGLRYLLSGERNMSAETPITAEVIEYLIGAGPDGLIAKGSIKVIDTVYNPIDDNPAATDQIDYAYPLGPDVIMAAITQGNEGRGGGDNSFAKAKYLNFLEGQLESGIPGQQMRIVVGNEGVGVFTYPRNELAGGAQVTQIVCAQEFKIKQVNAGFLIRNALNKNNTDEYGTSLQY